MGEIGAKETDVDGWCEDDGSEKDDTLWLPLNEGKGQKKKKITLSHRAVDHSMVAPLN